MFSMDFLVKEFLFDCRVRSLSEQTILNYKKQLGHFVRFLETECKVTNIEDLKPLHIKLFIRHYQERQCKLSYVPYKIGKLQIQGFSEPTTPNKIKQSYHITQKAARSRPRAAFLRGKLGRRQDFSKK